MTEIEQLKADIATLEAEMREVEAEKNEKEVWFCIVNTQTGELKTDENGNVQLFSLRQAQAMMANDCVPRSWWATREFKKYEGEQE